MQPILQQNGLRQRKSEHFPFCKYRARTPWQQTATAARYLAMNADHIAQRSRNKRDECWVRVLQEFNDVYGRECRGCGHTGPYCHFDWAHYTRDDKVDNLANLVARGCLERVEEELKRVRLLCKLCHSEETAKENGWEHAFD